MNSSVVYTGDVASKFAVLETPCKAQWNIAFTEAARVNLQLLLRFRIRKLSLIATVFLVPV